MIIIDTIETGIDIDNPIEAFIDAHYLVNILKDKYENKCYMGKLVKTVLSITDRSRCMINQMGSPTKGIMSVRFSAECEVYHEGELVCGLQVLENDGKHIVVAKVVGKRKEMICMIAVETYSKSISVGQIIPIRVISSKYPIGRESISCVASIDARLCGTRYYEITDAAKLAIPDALVALFKETVRLMEATDYSAMVARLLKKQEVAKDATPIINIINGKSKIVDGMVIGRPDSMNLALPEFVSNKKTVLGLPTPATLNVVATMFIKNYIATAEFVMAMHATYLTADAIKDNANLWLIYKSLA